MKKTLIASAIAALATSGSAFAMEGQTEKLQAMLDELPTIYGNLQLSYVYETSETDGSPEDTTNGFVDQGSTLGIKHDHEIAPGLTGFVKAEFEFDGAAGKGGNGDRGLNIDEMYLGIKGDFGSVQFGSDDTVYEWVNIIDISEAVGLDGNLPDGGDLGAASDIEAENLQYYTPDFGGFTGGLTVPLTQDSSVMAILGGTFGTDLFAVNLGYAMGADNVNDAGTGTDVGDSIGLSGELYLGDFTLQAQFETKDADENNLTGAEIGGDTDYFGLQGIFGVGQAQFAAGYELIDEDGGAESDAVFLQALYNLSDNMYTYAEYNIGTEEVDGAPDTDNEAFAVGLTYVW